jgi:hypothetical protein
MRSLVIALALVSSACKRLDSPKPVSEDQVTSVDAEIFGKRYADVISSCTASSLKEVMDLDSIAAQIVSKLNFSANEVAGFVRGFSKSSGDSICSQFTGGSKSKFLRVLTIDGKQRPLIRVGGTTVGVSYLELRLGRRVPTGPIKAIDAYVYASGGLMSEAFASLVESVTSTKNDLTMMGDSFKKIGKLMTQKQYQEVRDLIATLPKTVRVTKAVMMNDFMASTYLGDEVYAEAIENFEKTFPNDPALDLISMDGLFFKKKWDELLVRIEKLDRRVGGDPQLALIHASVLLQRHNDGDIAKAAQLMKSALQAEPDNRPLIDANIDVMLATKVWPDVVAALELLRTVSKDVQPDSLLNVEAFAEFIKTPEFAIWKKSFVVDSTPESGEPDLRLNPKNPALR